MRWTRSVAGFRSCNPLSSQTTKNLAALAARTLVLETFTKGPDTVGWHKCWAGRPLSDIRSLGAPRPRTTRPDVDGEEDGRARTFACGSARQNNDAESSSAQQPGPQKNHNLGRRVSPGGQISPRPVFICALAATDWIDRPFPSRGSRSRGVWLPLDMRWGRRRWTIDRGSLCRSRAETASKSEETDPGESNYHQHAWCCFGARVKCFVWLS